MADHHPSHDSDHRNHMTRRAALHGAASVGALALPAGAAVALPTSGDLSHPLLALWREYEALGRSLNEDETESRNFFRLAGVIETGDDSRMARMDQIGSEIEAARPDDLIGLAVQVAYAAYWSRIGTVPDEVCDMAESAALGLARHAGVEMPTVGEAVA